MKCLLPLLLLGVLHAADDMPAWCIKGILSVESRSYYLPDGTIRYVDRRNGKAGELGCTQITPDAFKRVRQSGESFQELASSTVLCVDVTRRYIRWIYDHKANHDWLRAVGMYHSGFGTDRHSMNRRINYLNRVRNAGMKS